MSDSDDLTLIAGDRAISGWTEISVCRGIERCPSDFQIGMTELYPGEASDMVIQPGDTCQVKLGADLVCSGYIDRVMPSIEPGNHILRVSGRGKCQDLVDCSAEWPGGQIMGSSVLEIATKLASHYGITANALTGVGGPIPQFNMNIGETAWEIIERICRYRALLAYDGPDGNLLLSGIGTTSAASGFSQGVNVMRADATWSMDERFYEYAAFLIGVDIFKDIGDGGNLISTAHDSAVRSSRRKFIVAEASDNGQSLAQRRAEWECMRRYGRGRMVRITTDNWRDSAGVLYTPNTLVPLDLPALKIVEQSWLISEVTYKRDERGTSCELILMPPSAFTPEPVVLQPLWADVPGLPP